MWICCVKNNSLEFLDNNWCCSFNLYNFFISVVLLWSFKYKGTNSKGKPCEECNWKINSADKCELEFSCIFSCIFFIVKQIFTYISKIWFSTYVLWILVVLRTTISYFKIKSIILLRCNCVKTKLYFIQIIAIFLKQRFKT